MAASMSTKEIERNIKSLLSIDGASGSSLPQQVNKASPAPQEQHTDRDSVQPQYRERTQRRVYITDETGGNRRSAQNATKRSVHYSVPPNQASKDTTVHHNSPREIPSEATGIQPAGGTHSGGSVSDAFNRKALKPAGHRAAAITDRQELSSARESEPTLSASQLQDILNSSMILELKEKSKAFPKAKFICHLCNYHMHEIQDVMHHKELRSHKRKVKAASDTGLLEQLPSPTSAHLAALDVVLQEAYESNVLRSQELVAREQIVATLKDTLTDKIPGFSVRLYGSCASGSALTISDVNVALELPESTNRSDALDVMMKTLLEQSDKYKSVTKNLTSRSPYVAFLAETVEGKPNVSFSMAFTDVAKVCSCAKFLKECFALEERVRKLAVLLKVLCKMCRADSMKDHMIPSVTFDVMVVYFAQQLRPPLLPVLHEYIKEAKESDLISESEMQKASEVARQKWKVQNHQSLADLWLRLLKFYTFDFDKKAAAVAVSDCHLLPKMDLKWNGKKLAVQDPACYRHNIVHCVKNAAAFDYVEDCLVEAYRYFGIPQTKAGPAFRYVRSQSLSSASADARSTEKLVHGKEDLSILAKPQSDELDGVTYDSRNEAGSEADVSDGDLCAKLQSMSANSGSDTFADRPLVPSAVHPDLEEQYCYDPKKVELLSASDMAFGFNCSRFTKGKPLPKFCIICHQGGHSTEDCVEGQVPDLKPLPAFTTGLRKMLDKFLQNILDFSAPSQQALASRNDLLRMVEHCVQQEYSSAKLTLFGSSNNGFGAADSDLDICLTFDGQDMIGDIDVTRVIERLAKCLYKERSFKSIVPIPTAKVPIVKFYSKVHRLEGDLSLYNTLAQRNTSLLRCYSEIDQRVRLLGYGLKVFAKTCEIGDASRGSLSSYSYVLMVIYFLQQCQPPVLPVLQELCDDLCPKEKRIVDGWDTYFFDQLQRLPAIWPHVNENKKTASELWLEMFRFYTEQFDMQNTVVSIRQYKKLTRLEKLWNGPTIAIEDPFDLDHNLGAALSVKMHTFIMTVLINGRALYGTPPTERLADDMLWDYFLHPKALIGNLVLPNDRGCRVCQKIGHLARDCPVLLQRKERDRKAKAKKQQQTGDGKVADAVGRPSSNNLDGQALQQYLAQFMLPLGQGMPLMTESQVEDVPDRVPTASTSRPVAPTVPAMATAAGEQSRSAVPVDADASGPLGAQQPPLASWPPSTGTTLLDQQKQLQQALLILQLQNLQQHQLLQQLQLQPQQQQILQHQLLQRQLQQHHLQQLLLQTEQQMLLLHQKQAQRNQQQAFFGQTSQQQQPLLYLPTAAPAIHTSQTTDPLLRYNDRSADMLRSHAAAYGQVPMLALSQSSQVQQEKAVASHASNTGLLPLPQLQVPLLPQAQQVLMQRQSHLPLAQLQQLPLQSMSASADDSLQRLSSSDDLVASSGPNRMSPSGATRAAVEGSRSLSSPASAEIASAAHSFVPVLNSAPATAAAAAPSAASTGGLESARWPPMQEPLRDATAQPGARVPTATPQSQQPRAIRGKGTHRQRTRGKK